MKVLLNHVEVGVIESPSSGAWTNWQERFIKVLLEKSQYQLRLEATSNDGLPNIAYMNIAGEGANSLSCDTDLSTSVAELEKLSDIMVVPNPFNYTFYVDTNVSSLTYVIYHASGKLMEMGNLAKNSNQLGKFLSASVYLLQLSSKKLESTQMIIKLWKNN
ncbi:MAG: T9SS type A sorting domain-containing protein [Saprospiraceae bacterium]